MLFVCFNTGLKNHLREREASSGVEFWNFHALCRYLAGKRRSRGYRPIRRTRRLRSTSPMSCHAMIEAIEKIGPQYDSIFVDEAQDSRTPGSRR